MEKHNFHSATNVNYSHYNFKKYSCMAVKNNEYEEWFHSAQVQI